MTTTLRTEGAGMKYKPCLEQAFTSIIALNNYAVVFIREGKYSDAQLLLTLALAELHDHTDCSLIMMRPPVVALPSFLPEKTATLDNWMLLSNRQDADTIQDSFYIYREGVLIPIALPSSRTTEEVAIQYKSIAFAVFFNQGLAHHLCFSAGSVLGDKMQQMAASAHQLYRLAMQYRHEEQSSKGRFLLAVCNNLAVLDHQWNPSSSAATQSNKISPYFEYLQMLLGNYMPTIYSSIDDLASWSMYWSNVLLALGWTNGARNHACAA